MRFYVKEYQLAGKNEQGTTFEEIQLNKNRKEEQSSK